MIRKNGIILIGTLITILLILSSYFFPNFILSKLIEHFNTTSSLIIMILTLIYVITTNKQLFAMKDQLEIMKNETNLQIQPIIEPIVKEIKLEKIRALMGPEDDFMTARIMSRLFCDFNLSNIGNGAALNICVYPIIQIENTKIPSPSQRPELTHCVSENNKDERLLHIMMFDMGIEIAKAIIEDDVKLDLIIYYKNVFGIGFKEKITFSLFSREEEVEKWKSFFNNKFSDMEREIKKHNAIKPISKDDAKNMLNKIQSILDGEIDSDFIINYQVLPQSYKIEIVDYEKAINIADKINDELFEEYFNGKYDVMKKNAEEET